MYRKLAMSLVSVLALMCLFVSAQVPDQPGSNPQPNYHPVPLSADSDLYANQAHLSLGWGGGHNGMRREEMELDQQCHSLVQQLEKAEGVNKDKIKTRLTEMLGKQFDFRQKRHESEITALEAQVKKLKEIVQKRQENRKEIIGKRFDQLLRDSEGLGW